jgi:hypothetical protein
VRLLMSAVEIMLVRCRLCTESFTSCTAVCVKPWLCACSYFVVVLQLRHVDGWFGRLQQLMVLF